MEKRGATIFLVLAFLGLVAILSHKRRDTIDNGISLNGLAGTSDKIVGNSNVLGTQAVGPAFLTSNQSYMFQPSLMIPTQSSLPNVACGAC